MEKKLFRNEHDKVIAGVASGLATYLQVDVSIIRLLFILSTIFLAGAGLVAYIVMWIIVPSTLDTFSNFEKFDKFYQNINPNGMFNSPNTFNNASFGAQTKWNTPNFDEANQAQAAGFKKPKKNNEKGRAITGLILLTLGIYFLLRQFNLIPQWFNVFKLYKLWPLLIMGIGVSLIVKNKRKNEWEEFKKATAAAQENTTAEKTEADEIILPEDKDAKTPND